MNSRHPLEVYRFFRDELEAPYIQFIPIVEKDNETGNQEGDRVTARSVSAKAYGRFLIRIFDEWVTRDVGSMFVQVFDGVLASYVRGFSSLCVFQQMCGDGVALEHNGDVYSCDHYVEPAHLLGNIGGTSIEKLVMSRQQRAFGAAKSNALPKCCGECSFQFTCYGGCPKNRILPASDGTGKINWLCDGLKMFFTHTRYPMESMARLLRTGREVREIMKNTSGSPSLVG